MGDFAYHYTAGSDAAQKPLDRHYKSCNVQLFCRTL